MARKSMRAPAREGAHPEVIGRNGEVLSRRRDGGLDAANQFIVPERLKQDGWSLQWVRESCWGEPDRGNMTNHQENGWRPVPADRDGFSDYFGVDTKIENVVRRQGLVLMERPQTLTDEALREDEHQAKMQRNSQVEEFALSDLPQGFDRGYGKAQKRVNRTIEQAPAASYPTRQLAIGDDD